MKPPTQGNYKQHLKSGTVLGNIYRLKSIIIKDRVYTGSDEGKEKMKERTTPFLATINSAELEQILSEQEEQYWDKQWIPGETRPVF